MNSAVDTAVKKICVFAKMQESRDHSLPFCLYPIESNDAVLLENHKLGAQM